MVVLFVTVTVVEKLATVIVVKDNPTHEAPTTVWFG